MTPEYYTMDELRSMGCPDELLMQYVFMTKDWVDKALRTTCKDCGVATTPGRGSARCASCWEDRCGHD